MCLSSPPLPQTASKSEGLKPAIALLRQGNTHGAQLLLQTKIQPLFTSANGRLQDVIEYHKHAMQVQAKAQEIKLLNEKIAIMTEEMAQLHVQVKQSKEQLTNNKNQFILAGEHKKSEIQAELQKINEYL